MLPLIPCPAVIAHRGSCIHAPENTLAAFKLAVEQGADAIELDAKLTSDGHVIIIHDLTVDRTTDGKGKVSSFSLAEIRKLDAGAHFDAAFKGEPVPTLEEVFAAVGKHLPVNVELTNYEKPTDRLPEAVAEIVRAAGMEKRVLFSSFNPLALLRIRKALPGCQTGLLAFPGFNGALARSFLGRLIPHQALHPALPDTTARLVQGAHRTGRKVLVYTVNEPEDMRRLFEYGIDGIFTDDPALARQTLSAFQKAA